MKTTLPKHLYHRTNHFKDLEGILEKGAIVPSIQLKQKETRCGSRSFDFVSMTEGKCVESGGKLQIVFDTEKIKKKNEIFNLWENILEKDPKSIFLHELEWRSCNPVQFEKSDIKEIVLYKNFMIKDTPHLNTPIYKREMTLQEKGIKIIGKKYNIPIRIVSMESRECNKVERKQELIEKIANFLKDL
jgi:hypothetical protein